MDLHSDRSFLPKRGTSFVTITEWGSLSKELKADGFLHHGETIGNKGTDRKNKILSFFLSCFLFFSLKCHSLFLKLNLTAMKYVADLHIHSKFSRATSREIGP